jgi:hypothetical protein
MEHAGVFFVVCWCSHDITVCLSGLAMAGPSVVAAKVQPCPLAPQHQKALLCKKTLLPQPRKLFLMQITSPMSNHLSVKFALARRVWANNNILV